MMFVLGYVLIILTSYSIGLSHCHLPVSTKDKQCPPWMFYEDGSEQCVCHDGQIDGITRVLCTSEGTLLFYDFCMTYNEESDTTSAGYCPYFEIEGHNTSLPGYIILPDNISELNEYMCGSMNRKGVVCSQCIDGYGPALSSLKFECVDCTNVWYGVPLYLVVEIVPVTVFFIIVVLFQLDLTSAPITSLVLFSNLFPAVINFALAGLNQTYILTILKIVTIFYGILSLDFIRFVIPPFCVSPDVNIVNIIYLQSLSAILPFIYIVITWILIQLHSRNCRVVVWTWRSLNRVLLKCIDVNRRKDKTVVRAFATFFLLSFSKVTVVLFYPLAGGNVLEVNHNSSTTVIRSLFHDGDEYASETHILYVVLSLSVFLFILLPLVCVIALYPIKAFRGLLTKCCHHQLIVSINFFVEKYYFCFKDGLDGGRDKRSFASAYFWIVPLSFVALSLRYNFLLLTILFAGYSLVILIVQPYKKRYIAAIESLVFADLALITALVATHVPGSLFHVILSQFGAILPLLGIAIYIGYRLLKKLFSNRFQTIKPSIKFWTRSGIKNHQLERREQSNMDSSEEPPLPDRVVNPQLYCMYQDSGVES